MKQSIEIVAKKRNPTSRHLILIIQMMTWDQKFEVGHDRIDAEHRIFFGLIVDFKEAQLAGAPKDKLLRILNEISKYAEFHFVSEENIMIDFGYIELEEHQKLHQQLLAEVLDKYYEFKHDMIHADGIFDFIFLWFALHTSREDKKLADCIKLDQAQIGN